MDWEPFYARFREPGFVPGYEIQNRLGGGAFGEVYKARKASIGKSFAIKFLKVDDDGQRDAALRELEQVRHFAALDHPNLVTIEDMGTALGVPYLVMGYAGEDTLARRLKQGPLDEHTTLLYFVQACRGVLALHDRRLVHFDIKPSNVFLKGDVARLGDYGLSKMLTDGRSTLSFGRGTPQYMAPEMLKNRADHRADVYSLGVVLYESLTGRLPYEASVPGALALREDDRPPEFPGGFPARLRPIVTRCLRLAPEARYASVADLLADLGHSARLGDSVRGAPGPAHARAAPAFPGAANAATPATSRSDVRQTAAEITRGAVEVARGVWDGLQARAPSAAAPARSPAPASGSAHEPRPAPEPLVPAPSGAAQALPAPRDVPEGSARGDVLVVHTLVETPLPAAVAAARTIPVPPPVPGGWLGTLAATALLALEVLVSLARGLFAGARRAALRGGAGGARVGSGALRFARGALRLLLFALLLALLGGLTTLVVFLALGGRGEG